MNPDPLLNELSYSYGDNYCGLYVPLLFLTKKKLMDGALRRIERGFGVIKLPKFGLLPNWLWNMNDGLYIEFFGVVCIESFFP